MNIRKVEYYKACDEAIQAMNRSNLELFGRLKMAKWDEINVIREVRTVYRKSAREARRRYYEVAFEAYLLMCALCDIEPKKAHRMAEKAITDEWVDGILKEPDLVTLYSFDSEADRKAYRLAETLEVAPDRSAEIDKALRFWSRQLGQYAINFTDYAMVQAMDDAGIEYAEWVTMHDERVCAECGPMDGNIYKIDEVPPKPHINCRCRLRPVLEDAGE